MPYNFLSGPDKQLMPLLTGLTVFLLLLFLFSGRTIAAVQSIDMADGIYPKKPIGNVGFLEDKKASFTADELFKRPDLFSYRKNRPLHFGTSTSVWWFTLSLDNTRGPDRKIYLEMNNPRADDVRISLKRGDGSILFMRQGDFPPVQVIVPHATDPTFPFDIRHGEKVNIILRVKTTNAVMAAVTLHDSVSYKDSSHLRDLWNGAMTSAFAILFLYNLLIWFRLRWPTYGWYCLYLPISWLLCTLINGFVSTEFFPDNSWLQNDGPIVTFGLAYFTLTGFSWTFLNLKEFRYLAVLARILIALSILEAVSAFFLTPASGTSAALYFLTYMFPLAGIIFGVTAWIKGKTEARFYITGQFASWIGQIVYMLYVVGALHYTWFSRNSLSLSILVDAILLSLALADKIEIIQKARLVAENNTRQALQMRHDELEAAVQARTAELDEARRNAEKLALMDPLTGLSNRRAIMENAAREFSLAKRRSTNLSVIMMDIDHFKQINDGYGHAEGDRVLIELADWLKKTSRESDIYGRLGGRNF